MGEDCQGVEMSLLREQRTTSSTNRKLLTVAEMQMANMSACTPQFCPHHPSFVLAQPTHPMHLIALRQPLREKIKAILGKGNPHPDPDCRAL